MHQIWLVPKTCLCQRKGDMNIRSSNYLKSKKFSLKNNSILLLVAILFLVSACQSQRLQNCSIPPATPNAEHFLNFNEPNTVIKLSTPRGFEQFRDYSVILFIENLSDQDILIFNGSAKILRITEDGYQELKETAEYQEDYFILTPQGTENSLGSILLSPYIMNKGKEEELLITVRGFLYEDGKICPVVYEATIQVTVYP